jgi:twitching motility two-component system response regulator PilG
MGKRVLQVAAFGLRPNELNVLRSISVLSGHSARAVGFDLAAEASQADIFIVDAESGEDHLSRWQDCDPQRLRPAIVIDSTGKTGAARSLRRPLLASRLLATLDEIALSAVRGGPRTLSALAPAASPAAAAATRQATRRRAVLVVDDSPTVRKQLELALSTRDVETTLVATGEHALDAIAQRSFDLVLLDVVLPGTDGYQVCKAIKKGYGAKSTPVVMLTSRSSPFDRLHGSLAGCDSYLVKPVRQSEFEAVINKYLSGSPSGLLDSSARPLHA